MASISRPKVEFSSASINRVLELPPYQPNSQIHSAIDLLTGTGEGDVNPVGISIIPIDLSGHNSVLIRFKKPVMPYVPKSKGLDSHELRIQKLSDTEPRTEELDIASRDGFDTGHDALIASMNSVRQTYFSTTDVLPSPQLIRVQAKNGDMVEIPLYIPIIFFGPSGKKSVAVVTRFPREYIAVEASKSLDRPVGVVMAGENKIVRNKKPDVSSAAATSTSAWAFPKKNDKVPKAIPPLPIDESHSDTKIDDDQIINEPVAEIPLENIISKIEGVRSNRDVKRLLRILNNTGVTGIQRQEALEKWKRSNHYDTLKPDDPIKLLGEIIENVVAYQDIFDNTQRVNGGWLMYRSGGILDFYTYAWKVDPEAIERTIDKYLRLYQNKKDKDSRRNYVEYASLKYLLESEWVADKRWKN